MKPLSELEILAANLQRNAIAISLFCEQRGFPRKSLGNVEPTTILPEDAPESLLAAKEAIKEAALRLSQLTSDPREFLNSFQVEVRFQDFATYKAAGADQNK